VGLGLLDTGMAVSNLSEGTDACTSSFCIVLSCVGRALLTG
jgi:hypothetical protein